MVIKNKEAETIVTALYYEWVCNFGVPTVGFWCDNGGEFQIYLVSEMVERLGSQIIFGPGNSPWSNGWNEWSHGVADVIW